MSHFFYVGGGIRGHCHTFYFMLKMAYNSSRNAKKILGRGGANPLNCHTKWGGGVKKKCDKCHTFFFSYFDTFPNSYLFPRVLVFSESWSGGHSIRTDYLVVILVSGRWWGVMIDIRTWGNI